jgi:hypothetical protein
LDASKFSKVIIDVQITLEKSGFGILVILTKGLSFIAVSNKIEVSAWSVYGHVFTLNLGIGGTL